MQPLGVVQDFFAEAGQDCLVAEDPSYRPRTRGQDSGILEKVSIRVHGAGEQGRLATSWRFGIVLTVLLHEDGADLAEIVDTAEHLVTPDLAGPRRVEFPGGFPRHRIAGTEIGDIVLGVGLGQLLRAEHLHGVPETYDPRWIIRHVYHHPGVDVMHGSRISSWILLGLRLRSFACTQLIMALAMLRMLESPVHRIFRS